MNRKNTVAMHARACIENFLVSDTGLTITEYAIAAGLIAASIGGTFALLGTTIDGMILALSAFL
jgi:Flp pilus assembly pilin Flp